MYCSRMKKGILLKDNFSKCLKQLYLVIEPFIKLNATDFKKLLNLSF